MRSPTPEREDLSLSCQYKEARQYEKELLKRAAELEPQAGLAAKEFVAVMLENKTMLDSLLMRREIELVRIKDELDKCDSLRTDLVRFNLGVMSESIPRQQESRN